MNVWKARNRSAVLTALVLLCWPTGLLAAPQEEGGEGEGEGWQLDWGLEAKAHFRDSDSNRFRSPFPFTPDMLPPGEKFGFLETVNEGGHFEVSTVSLFLEAGLGDVITAYAKIDFIDLYDRNPTSEDHEVDVDEAWLRFGRETEPGHLAEDWGLYLKVGKFPHFERQDDRHLESYGLISTAFNRFEDAGLEFGADLGRRVYVKASLTQGNPVFIRDPNALAGDNGLAEQLSGVNLDPELKSGVVIFYDAEVESIDVDGDFEFGVGLGVRLGPEDERWVLDLLGWSYRRDLAEDVELNGTLYGGDLDLLRGPLNLGNLLLTDDQKEETGANLWFYAGSLAVFAQIVDSELAGIERTGYEVEASWRFDLPLRWAVGGRQLFPYIAPAVRYSQLAPEIDDIPNPDGEPPPFPFPAVSVRWEWEKIDYGLRLGILEEIDLTLEYADHTFVTAGGDADNDEFLVTLRWKI